MSASGTLEVIADFVSRIVKDLGETIDPSTLKILQSFAEGTGDNQIDFSWSDQRPLVATSEDFDLSGGMDTCGTTITPTKIKLLIVQNTSITDVLLVGGAAATGFVDWVADPTDIVSIAPGGAMILLAPLAGYAISPTTDLLKVDSGAATINYKLLVAGLD